MKFDKQTIATARQVGVTMNVQTTVDNSAIVLLEAPVKTLQHGCHSRGRLALIPMFASNPQGPDFNDLRNGRVAGLSVRVIAISPSCAAAPDVAVPVQGRRKPTRGDGLGPTAAHYVPYPRTKPRIDDLPP